MTSNSDAPADLLERVRHAILINERTEALAAQVPDPNDESPLRVALVGPYSAGKSLLVAALLRMPAEQAEQISAAKPHTVDMTTYPWREHHLLDLPGTLSGLDTHDDTARRGVRSADLLLIVTTVELPGEHEADAIRQLLERDGFRGRCAIAINKAASENSDREVIRAELERRLGNSEQVPVILTDARDFLDAMNEPGLTEADRNLLRNDSGIPDLEDALEHLLSRSGAPRQIAQLHEAVRVLDDALTIWELTPEEEVLDSTASRVQASIDAARTEATEAVNRALDTLEDNIRAIGADLATALDPQSGTPTKADTDRADKAEQRHTDRFVASVNTSINDAVTKLAGQLGAAFDQQAEFEATLRARRRKFKDQPIKATTTDRVLEELGKRVSEAVGDKLTQLVNQGTRPGSPLNGWGKAVNTALRRTAKPYAHKHTADGLAKGMTFANTLIQIVGPAMDVGALVNEASQRRQLKERADEICAAYAAHARDLAASERTRVLAHLEDQLRPLLGAASPQIHEAEVLRRSREDACAQLRELRDTTAEAAAGVQRV